MSIVLQGSTSGSITLQEPAVAGSTVLDLPAVSGTILTTTSPKAGNVIQVVNATYSTQVVNLTTTYADTGLSAAITPSSSSSKILVIVSQSCKKSAGNANNALNLKLFRGATDLGQVVYVQGFSATAIDNYSVATILYLDSPATTSSTTYKTQFANYVAASSVAVQGDSVGVSTMTLMEIAA